MLATPALAGLSAHFVAPWVGGLGLFLLLIPLFWIAIIAIIVIVALRRRAAWFARGGYGQPGFRGGYWSAPSRAAESTLAERFAQGHVDGEDYRARLQVLRENAGPKPPVA
ncbi:MAG: hypothetical protein V4531_14555 [Actinomycetota bacterium]